MPTITVRRQVAESFKSKHYRESSVRASIREGLAAQIRAMREKRNWTQSELGMRAGMAQEVISKLEDPDNSPPTVRTLLRLASAFDVDLVVRFGPFSDRINYMTHLEPSDLAVPSFEEDRLTEDSDEGLADEYPTIA